MRVLLAGASGLLGQALRRALIANGDAVHVLVRREPRDGAETEWHPGRSELDPSVLRDVDAVVCLSGVSLGHRRWSDQVKRDIVASRVQPVATLARALAETPDRPSVYITASGAGCYGDTGSRVIDESAPYGNTFLAGVCRLWEGAADPAASSGVRVAHLRSGPVLAGGGDLMKRLKPIIWLGLGGRLGSGEQYLPWISLADHVAAMRFLLTADVSGPVNVTGPEPARNAEVIATMARLMHRPAVLPVPAFAIKAVLGGMAEEILIGQRAIPKRLLGAGFAFRHPTLEAALRAALTDGSSG
jgi:uncharacterized protein